jgi:hypothetical protein
MFPIHDNIDIKPVWYIINYDPIDDKVEVLGDYQGTQKEAEAHAKSLLNFHSGRRYDMLTVAKCVSQVYNDSKSRRLLDKIKNDPRLLERLSEIIDELKIEI